MPPPDPEAPDARPAEPEDRGAAPLGIRLSPTTRTEAFSDGVLAIAITLLVLEIRLPGPGSVLLQLLHGWPSFLAYLTSFLTIGIVWLNHHAFFGRINRINAGLQWGNLALLLFVSFLPFPTAILAAHVADPGWNGRTAAALYGIVGSLMTMPWVPMWGLLRRHPELFHAPYDAAFARVEGRRAWVGVVAYLACALVGLAVPFAAAFLYLAIAVFYAVTSQGWARLDRSRASSG